MSKDQRVVGAPMQSYRDLAVRAVQVADLACAGAMDLDDAMKLVRILKEAGGMVVSAALLIKSGENPTLGSGGGPLTLEQFATSQLNGMTRSELAALAKVVNGKLENTVAKDFAVPMKQVGGKKVDTPGRRG